MFWDSSSLELYSGFHKQNLPGFRIPQAKISQITETGSVPYMGQVSSKMDNKEISIPPSPQIASCSSLAQGYFFLTCLFICFFIYFFIYLPHKRKMQHKMKDKYW